LVKKEKINDLIDYLEKKNITRGPIRTAIATSSKPEPD